jgi:preprotein translocase subunit Sec63
MPWMERKARERKEKQTEELRSIKDVRYACTCGPSWQADCITARSITLALGWVAFAWVLQRAYRFEAASTFYDPFEILGLSTVRCSHPVIGKSHKLMQTYTKQGTSEKDIKRHYRKLSLKL